MTFDRLEGAGIVIQDLDSLIGMSTLPAHRPVKGVGVGRRGVIHQFSHSHIVLPTSTADDIRVSPRLVLEGRPAMSDEGLPGRSPRLFSRNDLTLYKVELQPAVQNSGVNKGSRFLSGTWLVEQNPEKKERSKQRHTKGSGLESHPQEQSFLTESRSSTCKNKADERISPANSAEHGLSPD